MIKRFAILGLVLAFAATAVAAGQGARSSHKASKMNITLKIIQGVTVRHPHAPAGDAGDVFSVDLTLLTIKNDFDAAPNTKVGNMSFSYLLHGSCSVAGNGCKGTVDIETMTKLPAARSPRSPRARRSGSRSSSRSRAAPASTRAPPAPS